VNANGWLSTCEGDTLIQCDSQGFRTFHKRCRSCIDGLCSGALDSLCSADFDCLGDLSCQPDPEGIPDQRTCTRQCSCPEEDNGCADCEGLAAGTYEVTVQAVEADSGLVLASRLVSAVTVSSDPLPAEVAVELLPADFTVGEFHDLEVSWSVNGLFTPQPVSFEKGDPPKDFGGPFSHDSCDEVAAAAIEIEVDGASHIRSCILQTDGEGWFAVGHQPLVRARLLGQDGSPLTEWSPPEPQAAAAIAGATDRWAAQIDFPHDRFLAPSASLPGSLWVALSFDGKGCTESDPPVKWVTFELLRDGVPVTPPPQLLMAVNGTFGENGRGPVECLGPGNSQGLGGFPWGDYTLAVTAQPAAASPDPPCWQGEFELVAGAGESNPVQQLDVPRLSTAPECTSEPGD